MKTFKQFLAEASGDLVQFLRENCRPACEDAAKAGNFFYRGTHAPATDELTLGDRAVKVIIASPRSDRRPRDTPKWAHEQIDDFFEKEFGQRLRSSTVFAIGASTDATKSNLAKRYGTVFATIPIGKYRAYWSPEVFDLTDHLFGDPDVVFDAPDRGEAQLTKLNYTGSDNVGALNHPGEVMLACTRYLAVPLDDVDIEGDRTLTLKYVKEGELLAAARRAIGGEAP